MYKLLPLNFDARVPKTRIKMTLSFNNIINYIRVVVLNLNIQYHAYCTSIASQVATGWRQASLAVQLNASCTRRVEMMSVRSGVGARS